jgi:lipopolysaccharide/colanic/teichoic acid biosynthesis glycosyltransferase
MTADRPIEQARCAKSIAKRTVDFALASVGLTVLAPVVALAGLGVAATMGRPILIRQRRPGLQGRPFTMYKFRTMREPRPGEGTYRTDGVRITRFGMLLRKTSIDELPELWNVIRGDMSLVGPRPLLMEYLPRYTERHLRRHEAKPGITGWAQVNGRRAIKFSQRFELDLWYVEHWNLLLDASIVIKTVIGLVGAKGEVDGQVIEDVDDIGISADVR